MAKIRRESIEVISFPNKILAMVVAAAHTSGVRVGLVSIGIVGLFERFWAIKNSLHTVMLDMPFSDDSFFYFSLGRNLATRCEAMIDSVSLTNGFQPLWGLFSGLAFRISSADPSVAVITLQVTGSILGVSTSILLFLLTYQLTRSKGLAFLMYALWTLSPQVVKHNINGMETALAQFSIALLFYLIAVRDRFLKYRGAALLTGIACGMAVLSRVDSMVFIWSGLTIVLLSREKGGPTRMKDLIGSVGVFLSGALLPVLPWLLFVERIGMPIFPESGTAVITSALLHARLPSTSIVDLIFNYPLDYAGYCFDNITVFTAALVRQIPFFLPVALPAFYILSEHSAFLLLSVVGVLVIGFVCVLLLAKSAIADKLVTKVFLLYFVTLTLLYSCVIGVQWYFNRYAGSLAMIVTVLLLVGGYHAMQRVSWRIRRVLATCTVGIVLCCFAGLLFSPGYNWMTGSQSKVSNDGLYDAALWLKINTAGSARVGGFATGLLGYYLPHRIVNLDGKVNGKAYRALVERRIWAYIKSTQVEYIVGWQNEVDKFLGREVQINDVLELVGTFGDVPQHPVSVWRVKR